MDLRDFKWKILGIREETYQSSLLPPGLLIFALLQICASIACSHFYSTCLPLGLNRISQHGFPNSDNSGPCMEVTVCGLPQKPLWWGQCWRKIGKIWGSAWTKIFIAGPPRGVLKKVVDLRKWSFQDRNCYSVCDFYGWVFGISKAKALKKRIFGAMLCFY